MKKIFTSMLLMLGCVAGISAQSITLQKGESGEVTYKDGDVIEVKAEKAGSDAFSYYQWDPELYLVAKANMTVTVTVASESSVVQFCGGDGNCMMTGPGNPVVKSIGLSGNKPEPMLIDILDMSNSIKDDEEITATVTIKALTKTSTYTLKFLPKNDAGILDVEAEANAVSVSGRSLNYNFARPTVLTLYTISGQAAVNHTLNGAGSLSLDALPGGVYIYRAGTRTGKFVVR